MAFDLPGHRPNEGRAAGSGAGRILDGGSRRHRHQRFSRDKKTQMTQDPLKNQPETKAAFMEYDKQQKVRLYKLACWFTAIGMPAGISLDMNIYPQDAVYFLKLRLVSSVLALVLFGLFYTPLGLRYYRLLCFTLPLIPQVFIRWMIYYTEGSVPPYYAGLSLILLAF